MRGRRTKVVSGSEICNQDISPIIELSRCSGCTSSAFLGSSFSVAHMAPLHAESGEDTCNNGGRKCGT